MLKWIEMAMMKLIWVSDDVMLGPGRDECRLKTRLRVLMGM